MSKKSKILHLQRSLVIDFLDEHYEYFELSESRLLERGEPTKKTFQILVKEFKAQKEGVRKEVAQMSAELSSLYKEYLVYSAHHNFTLPVLSQSQFSRALTDLRTEKDGREIVIFRHGRKQIKYVFPLLKKS